MNTWIRNLISSVWAFGILMGTTQAYAAAMPEVYTRSTYQCISIYWNSANLGTCKVSYRPVGTANWLPGQDLPYNKADASVSKKAIFPPAQAFLTKQYRGSLLNLNSGTKYEIRLVAGSQTRTITASTRSDNYKIKSTVKVGSLNRTLSITKGGSEKDGYVLYDGTGSTIDTKFVSQYGVTVNASYVIIRGFKIEGVNNHGVYVSGGTDIVVENCEITNYGSDSKEMKSTKISNRAGGVCVKPGVRRMTIQRCNIHHPRYPASRWGQIPGRSHPFGAKAIIIGNSDSGPWEANHVVRYNICSTDSAHAFEDVMNGYPNYSKTGFPGADTDIYCNRIETGTDDLIEADGGGQNVRIWGNYLDNCTAGISLQSCTVGPVYIFRNVFKRGGTMFKFSGNNHVWGGKRGEAEAFFVGPVYVYHNTSIDPSGAGFKKVFGTYPHDDSRNFVSRNNVWMTSQNYVSSGYTTVKDHPRFINCSFDYDLHNRPSKFKGDQGSDYDKHGITGNAKWRSGHLYQIDRGSNGYNRGAYLPNFNLGSAEEGNAPDMGAIEYGSSDMVFGPKAKWAPLNAGKSVLDLPAAPSGLTAKAASDSRVNLSWKDNANNETGYKIQRKTGATGTYFQIAVVAANAISYSDIGLDASTMYYYRVCATNGDGDSDDSNEAIATTKATVTPIPAAPSGLSVKAVSSTEIDLSWKDNANNETGFVIERQKGKSGVFTQFATVGANVTSYVDTQVKENITYFYRIQAINSAGASTYSNTAEDKTPVTAAATAEVGLVVTDDQTSEFWHGAAIWTVSRTGNTLVDLTVHYTVGGTATNGVDYRANTPSHLLTGTVVIPAGSSSAMIKIWAYSDSVNDPDETVVVTLESGTGYNVGSADSGTVMVKEGIF